MAEETNNYKDAGEQPPSTVDQQAPQVAEENSPSTEVPEATDIPSANAPDPKAANPQVNPDAAGDKPATDTPAGDTNTQTAVDESAVSAEGSTDDAPKEKPAAKKKPPADGEKPAAKKTPADGEKPAAKAKKEKAPAVEDKPFSEFIQQDYLPALQKALSQQGAKDVKLSLSKEKIPVLGFGTEDPTWQVIGSWQDGRRNFNLYFPQESIQGQRAFSCNLGTKPSTLEPFLIDERKITLDLLVFGVVQRLNAQKWLERN